MADVWEDEKDVLMDHEYDGIQELDNNLPAWWLGMFYVTIIFGVVYFLGYEVFGWYLQPDSEFGKEMAAVQERLEKGSGTDKAALEPLTDEASLAAGKTIYMQNCAACHGDAGEGKIGPNLTDTFWIHGEGDLAGVVHIVEEGVLTKGMIAWKAILGEKKIHEVSSYVLTLQGTNPENAKGPEGKDYSKKTE